MSTEKTTDPAAIERFGHHELLWLSKNEEVLRGLNSKSLVEAQLFEYERIMDLQRGDSIYEVCCGAGGFLYGWKNTMFYYIGGCDNSESLIQHAKAVLPGRWDIADHTTFTTERWDHVVAFGITSKIAPTEFETLVHRMIMKAVNSVSVFDIDGGENSAYTEEFVTGVFERLGIKYTVYPQRISNYENSSKNFNVTAWL
jgi:hypothetical protein